jgi:hypothetical protein
MPRMASRQQRNALLTELPILAAIVLSTASPALAQWTSNSSANTPVAVVNGDQAVPCAAATGDGKTWIGWFDNRSGSYAVYVQLLDRDGNPMLGANGLLVSANPQNTSLVGWDLISDSAGNCVCAFTDTRAGGDLDVYAYRISQSGTFLWGANGVALSNNADFEANPAVAELTDGSFVFVWPLLPNGTATGSIRAQRLDGSGSPLLGASDIALDTGTATNEKPSFCDVVAADAGKFIVQWVRNTATFTSPRHIRAQKYDSAGAPQWNLPNPVAVYDFNSVPIAYQPIVQPDGNGGALFCWHRSTALYDALVQHLDANGGESMPHNGALVSLEANRHKIDPALAYLPASGDMIVLFDRRDSAQGNRGVGVQRLSVNGTRLWGNDGIELAPVDALNEGFEHIVPCGDGAIATYFEYPTFGQLASNVLATRLDGNGNAVWSASPRALCTNMSSKDKPQLVTDGTGIARLVWDDERADSGDIYAQDVNVDGAIGPITTCTASTYCVGAPNSVGPGASIGWSGSTSLRLNDFTLSITGCPPNKSAIFFYGATASAGTPFHNGFLCTSGQVFRLPLLTTDTNGDASSTLDLANPPNPNGQITTGSQWNFQMWYRDPSAPPSGTNTSNALQASFCP